MKKLSIENNAIFILTDRLTRKYLCGVDVAEGVLCAGQKLTLFTDARYFYGAKQKLEKGGVDCKLYKEQNDLFSFIKQSGAQVLYIDYEKCSVKEYFDYLRLGCEIKDGCEILSKLRSIKSQTEIENIKKACEIMQKAYYSTLEYIKVGVSEVQVKEILEDFMIKYGAEGSSFETIVAFGKNSAVPHHETGDTVLTENSVVLIDAGCLYKGYCSDLTRTCFFGVPDKKFIDYYNAVLKANLLAQENIKNLTTAKEADGFARDYLKTKGLSEYFTHSLGHGVGLEIHEYPRLSFKSDAVLQNDMVFTIEPGVYLDGEFGIRIEDTVLLNDGKVERLFSDDKNLLIIK